MTNSLKMRSNAELSPYQKRIESIDNPILCVAEAEKMINEIGVDLISEIKVVKSPKSRWFKTKTIVMRLQRVRF
ncbi:MAG: hypothetical protein PHS86_02230 [Syntrophaceae bacterium]|nr:hypothetical protein [Syntrophaceae bacterium]